MVSYVKGCRKSAIIAESFSSVSLQIIKFNASCFGHAVSCLLRSVFVRSCMILVILNPAGLPSLWLEDYLLEFVSI